MPRTNFHNLAYCFLEGTSFDLTHEFATVRYPKDEGALKGVIILNLKPKTYDLQKLKGSKLSFCQASRCSVCVRVDICVVLVHNRHQVAAECLGTASPAAREN